MIYIIYLCTYVTEGSGTRHVDPALQFYSDIPLIITTNNYIDKETGNGTLCRGISFKLKKNSDLKWKKLGWEKSVISVN